MPESLFNKAAGLRPETLSKRDYGTGCSPVNFAKFLRTPFLQNTSARLLLLALGYRETALKECILSKPSGW